jgi:membrane protease subunit HflK
MPWNEPGGDKDPWNKGKSSDSSKGKPSGKPTGNATDNIEDITRKMNEKISSIFGNKKSGSGSGSGRGGPSAAALGMIGVALLAAWLATGFYTIDAAENGVEFRFGAFNKITDPGLHWKFPRPIDTVEKVNVDKQRKVEDRMHMLTQDENIIDLSVTAHYKIKSIKDYLFNVYLPDLESNQSRGTIFQVMRSALREVAGRNTLDSILTENRSSIGLETLSGMQVVLDKYGSGLEVVKVNLDDAAVPKEVKEAFDDVNKAQEDLVRYKHEAEAYAEAVVPVAEGKASRLMEAASAYKSQVISKSEGDASRFSQLMAEYQKAPEVTRNRLYIETIEEVYKNSTKVMVDTKSGNNLLYLPLNQLGSKSGSNEKQSDFNPITSGAVEALRNQRVQQQQQLRNSTRSGTRQGR